MYKFLNKITIITINKSTIYIKNSELYLNNNEKLRNKKIIIKNMTKYNKKQ